MKILSILLRLIAIAGAAFAIYTWVDTKGKTSESMEHMRDVAGETLQARTAKVPNILKEKAKAESDLRKTTQSLKDTEATLSKTEGELRDAGDMISENQKEISEKNIKIKELNATIVAFESAAVKSASEISDLEAEIVKIKSETEPLIADLKAQIVELEEALARKDIEIAEAVAAAEEALMAEIEEQKANVYVDPVTGETKVRTPVYIPVGEIITVLKANDENTSFVVNKGSNAGFKLNDRVEFKNEGKFVAEFSIVLIQGDVAVCALSDARVGIAESIFVGDLYEMNPIVEEVEEVDSEDEE